MLEAVASQDLWIWHAFFGVAGSNNDINVLRQSPLFNDVVDGFAPEVSFEVNGTEYSKGYYLVDGIYPEWATFVKSFPRPMDPKRKLFKTMQEAARKDVERAFGVLQARWVIIRNGARFWDRNHLKDIMYACIILHNMIVENEGENINNWESDTESSSATITPGSFADFQESLHRRVEIRDRDVHNQLKADLVEHIWQNFGDNVT